MAAQDIQYVFVLMLENRSFDHMLGFSAITGTGAVTGQPAQIDGLTGTESNTFNGTTYTVLRGADYIMPLDPGHEFTDVLEQLCGQGAAYPPGGAYPPIVNTGFVASYAASSAQASPGEIMKCYTPDQLPVLAALAREFVVCDNWRSPMPGPTWPNRLFVHAASSGGLDHSPTSAEILLWETLDGFTFPNGDIFDALNKSNVKRRLYAGDDFPMVAALKGIALGDIRHYSLFAQDVAEAAYDYSYTFIEPSYNVASDYKCSTSQHPLDDVTRGESLIKCIYEAIRNSPHWNNSLLVITWDEHGGFYDHTVPPPAVAPRDTQPGAGHNKYGFTFERYGARVPAVVISPLIPRNLVDHRLYDHTSILATLEAIFPVPPLTARDAAANNLTPLATLPAARQDAPTALPAPADSGDRSCPAFACSGEAALAMRSAPLPPISRPQDSINDGSLPGVLHVALRQELAMSPAGMRPRILARFSGLKTRADARQYLDQVRAKIHSQAAPARGTGR